MRKLLISLLCVLASASAAQSQWRKIADFRNFDGSQYSSEYINCVYFLDLPGPPRVGFVGTASELYRTSDRGATWKKVWGNGFYWSQSVQDIYFMDSLNGWFSFSNGPSYSPYDLYRTRDGGFSWDPVVIPMRTDLYYGPGAVWYSKAINRLFLSMGDSARMLISDDTGRTWRHGPDYYTGYCAFSSPQDGIIPAWFPSLSADSVKTGFLYTRDGGLRWDTTYVGQIDFLKPLAIPGTPICFATGVDSQTVVYRSDNYGVDWKRIYDFGPIQDSLANEINPRGTGDVEGTLDRLSIQTDIGMYLSTDEGKTWKNEGGPGYIGIFSRSNFYSAKGYTFAARTYGAGAQLGDGLWEEDWNTESVKQPEATTEFAIEGPYPNPSAHLAQNVSVLVHYCTAGSTIAAQVFNSVGTPVGAAVTMTSDGQDWDRLAIPAPSSAGSYFIHVSVGGSTSTLSYSVY